MKKIVCLMVLFIGLFGLGFAQDATWDTDYTDSIYAVFEDFEGTFFEESNTFTFSLEKLENGDYQGSISSFNYSYQLTAFETAEEKIQGSIMIGDQRIEFKATFNYDTLILLLVNEIYILHRDSIFEDYYY